MKKQLFILGMASVFALTGCHGIKKVEYAKFDEETKKLDDIKMKSVKIKGSVEGTDVNFTYEIPQTAGQGLDALLGAGDYSLKETEAYTLALTFQSPKGIGEHDDTEYYVGMGFKVVSGKNSMEWNGKGVLASYQAENSKLSFSWKKA